MALFKSRRCWVLTLRGWLLLVAIILFVGILAARHIASFLAVSKPAAADVLILESWLPDYAMHGAVEEFKRGSYKYVITSGRVLNDLWLAAHYPTAAEFAAANLALMGIETNRIVAVPPPPVGRDRTFSSARAVHKWLVEHDPSVRAVNVYSLGAHSRRTRLLFQKAMGSGIEVGIIAHPASYDPRRWWDSMRGFDSVIGEGLAYCYAKCVFPFVTPAAD